MTTVQRLFFKITGFLIGLIALFTLLSFHYHLLSLEDNFPVLLKLFSRRDPQILILGDSHPAAAIHMNMLDERYATLCYPGDSWRDILLKAEFALRENPGIRYIMVPLDYHMFSMYRLTDRDITNPLRYAPRKAIVDTYRISHLGLTRGIIKFHIPLSSPDNWSQYRLILERWLGSIISGEPYERSIVIDENGSFVFNTAQNFMDFSPEERLRMTRDRMEKHMEEPIVNQELVELFDQLIGFCKENDIELIGIRFPLSVEYSTTAQEYGAGKIREVYEERDRYFRCVLDYEDLFRNTPEYFCNQDHLSQKGAERFTGILKKDIEENLSATDSERRSSSL